MKLVRILLVAYCWFPPALPARRRRGAVAPSLGHVLTLVHMFVRIAGESDDPAVSLRAIDDVLAGRNAAANEAVAGLMREVAGRMSRPRIAPPSPPSAATWSARRARTCWA